MKNNLVLLIMAFLVMTNVEAGRRSFTATWDAETLNRGEFELEQWMSSIAKSQTGGSSSGWLTVAPVYGLSHFLEVAFPWEVATVDGETHLSSYALEMRFRLYNPRSRAAVVKPALRFFYKQNFNNPLNGGRLGIPWAGANVILAFGDLHGSHATLNFGGYMDAGSDKERLIMQTAALGVAFTLAKSWRLGFEYFHKLSFGQILPVNPQFFIGPALSFSRGQTWMTLGAMAGLTRDTPQVTPRLMIAVAI